MTLDRLSLCMYTPSASGGHARYTHEVLSALADVGRSEGVRVSLVSSRDLDPHYLSSLYPIYATLPPLEPRSSFRNTASWACSRTVHYYRRENAFLRWIEDHDDVCGGIHFQEYTMWLAPRHFRSLRARGKRLFFTVHNVYPHRYLTRKFKAPYSRLLSWRRTAFRLCDALFVHSESLREQLAQFLGSGHPPIWVTPHGVWDLGGDPLAAPPIAHDRVQRRRLLFFGVIRRNKGLHTLLRAMERLDDCTLTVAGPPEDARYQQHVSAMIEELPAGRVELMDRFIEDDEMVRLFNQGSLVILPYTTFAGQSGVLHDALAHGLPVVATDVGALGESVRRWDIGQVVPPNDDAALAGAILDMLTPQRYEQTSGSVDRVRRDLSWSRTAEIMIEAYSSVMRDGTRATA